MKRFNIKVTICLIICLVSASACFSQGHSYFQRHLYDSAYYSESEAYSSAFYKFVADTVNNKDLIWDMGAMQYNLALYLSLTNLDNVEVDVTEHLRKAKYFFGRHKDTCSTAAVNVLSALNLMKYHKDTIQSVAYIQAAYLQAKNCVDEETLKALEYAGAELSYRTGDFEQALYFAKQCDEPFLEQATLIKSLCYYSLGNYDSAYYFINIVRYEKTISSNIINLALASIHQAKGNTDSSSYFYQKVNKEDLVSSYNFLELSRRNNREDNPYDNAVIEMERDLKLRFILIVLLLVVGLTSSAFLLIYTHRKYKRNHS